ncbi:aldehyde dehydrogenase family protein [Halomicrococcus sp. NG-SE-24]|uniref:2,5-dioxovalerate dehydrogenase n=1 Tax=Halomicrococcus sp. NG-SE-24 TaxID=3436928 RepID=UPI003D977C9D
MESFKNYIDGTWQESKSGDTFETTNPADTDEVVSEFSLAHEEDANQAVEAADAAQADWEEIPAPTRGKVLRETAKRLDDRKDELTETLVREEGKTPAEAGPEVQRAVDIFYYYAERAMDYDGTVKKSSNRDRDLYTVREPMGVAGLVTPWNYPIAIPAWKMAPALATGNTLVIKPSVEAPTVLAKVFECLAEALEESDAPDGVANMVVGSGKEVGSTILEHDAVDTVSFTGSRKVGEMIYQQATDSQKRVQTELGSKNPTVVMPSADVENAAQIVGNGAFGVTGQACTSTERALVHEEVYDEFVEELTSFADDIDVGPGLEGADMGPQVTESELEGTLDYIELAQEEGATLEYGGERVEDGDCENGFFIEPTIFTDTESDMRIMQEEVFGPFVGVMPISSLDEAIEVTNDVEYGLSAGIISDNHSEVNRYIEEADFGVIKVNEKTTGLELHVPFGGKKASSSETYREQGDEGMDFFTIIKTVYDTS